MNAAEAGFYNVPSSFPAMHALTPKSTGGYAHSMVPQTCAMPSRIVGSVAVLSLVC